MQRRISPVTYVLALSLGAIAWAALTLVLCRQLVPAGQVSRDTAISIVRGALVAGGALYAFITTGRLRDMGLSTWWARGVAVTPLGVVLLPLLFFYGGEPWDNEQGRAPEPASAGKIVLAYGALLLALALLRLALLALVAISA